MPGAGRSTGLKAGEIEAWCERGFSPGTGLHNDGSASGEEGAFGGGSEANQMASITNRPVGCSLFIADGRARSPRAAVV